MTDTPEAGEGAAIEAEPVAEAARHALLDALLASTFGHRIVESFTDGRDAWARVAVDDWAAAAQVVRTDLGCQYFSFLSGMDWQPNPNLDGEKTFTDAPKEMGEVIIDPAVRYAGGTTRFQVLARVHNVDTNLGITLTADLDSTSPTAPSWTGVYRGADWHEREAWEMFDFDFTGHPGLRHLYLPDAFEGHPLRKDYPLVARIVRPWPGLVDMEEMPPPPEQSTEETTSGEAK